MAPEPSFTEVIVDGREYVTKDWHGLMEILDDIYPASIFTGESGDAGPLIVTHLREIARLRGKNPAGNDGGSGA